MKVIYLLLSLLCFSICSEAQIVNMGASASSSKVDKKTPIYREITKDNVRLLTIGVGGFEDSKFEKLNSVSTLNKFKKVSDNYLRLSYRHHPSATFLNKTNVNTREIREAFEKLVNISSQSDVVIISILSHGEVINGEYYLICSNTDSRNYETTAISGVEIRSFLEKMANKGALVLLFLDTCHAAALFEKASFSPTSNGSIAFFASSMSNQKAKEIYQKCRFTETLLDIFLNENKHAFNEDGYVTIKSLDAQIKAALGAITKENQQQPYYKEFTNHSNLGDYPIIKEKEFVEYGSIWKNPLPFSPLAVSPNNGKTLDYCLVGVECLSLIGMIVFGPIMQPYYKNKISGETNVFARNDYREKGKNAAVGFCISTGFFLSSYIIRTLHVHNQLKIDFKEQQFASVDISPVVSAEFNGLALVFNF